MSDGKAVYTANIPISPMACFERGDGGIPRHALRLGWEMQRLCDPLFRIRQRPVRGGKPVEVVIMGWQKLVVRPGFIALVLLGALLVSSSVSAAEQGHRPITRQLIQLVEQDPEVRELLSDSLAAAKAANPDPQTNPAQSLADYYDFIDSASQLIPQEILANPPSLIRDQILQSICYFYFLVDQPLARLEDRGFYSNRIQYFPPFSDWLRAFADSWGDYLDTEVSWTQDTYLQFYSDPSFGIQHGWYESPTNWDTFNRFFSRYLSSLAMRPIADPDDAAVVVAPADSVPQGVWPIDADSRIEVDGGLRIKLATFYSIPELLGDDSPYKDAFAGGVLTHTFLNVNDYHRYHFAVGGIIEDQRLISENVALEVSWDAEDGRYDPIDSTGWQFSQTRGYVIVDTGEHGLVALIPMGMAQVSSVNFEDGVTVDSEHAKGDMLGTFLFGGSDFVMLFQDKAGFELVAPEEGPAGPDGMPTYAHLLMGEKYGLMTGKATD